MTEEIRTLIERVALESEEAEAEHTAAPDAPLPSHVRVTRGHDRTRVLQIRLSDAEYQALAEQAEAQHVPAPTLARALLLRHLAS